MRISDWSSDVCSSDLPLRRKLSDVRAWATGQRRDQSPGTRSQVAVLEIDTAFSTPERTLYKFNPLSQMTSEEVWGYIRMLELPYNSLHERGFISIGCEPCTRPVLPNQHERSEENTSELQSLMRISYAIFCLK